MCVENYNLPIIFQCAAHSGDANEEFVSESYRVSSKDMAEVDESMKRLGVGGTGGKGKSGTSGGGDVDDNDWENELEVNV